MRVICVIIVLILIEGCRKEQLDVFGERLIGEWKCIRVESLQYDEVDETTDTLIILNDLNLDVQIVFIEKGKIRLAKSGEKLSQTRVPDWSYHQFEELNVTRSEYIFDFPKVPSGFQKDHLPIHFSDNRVESFEVSEGYLDIINECDYAGSHGLNYVFVKE
jgi:hypothetical protein